MSDRRPTAGLAAFARGFNARLAALTANADGEATMLSLLPAGHVPDPDRLTAKLPEFAAGFRARLQAPASAIAA
ncbi:MAG: hypothetical protein BGN86_03685 [Caulobacterales bacterium 68-7]|nr:MAG: hypothetical protein BGN86_03685 [Caulobacterales bacterium 68-7]